MKIISMTIDNFRQFNGSHCIKFSTDENKNVTIIHGENGSGKTSLLNGFKWCFYGETDFDTGNENILNEQSIEKASEGDQINVEIKVEFEHDHSIYIAERTQIFQKSDNNLSVKEGVTNFNLWITGADGQTIKSDSPETHMNQILPLNMHPYFFFNGERIEKLAAASQSMKIQQAIKNLMGLEIVERSSHHIRKHVKKYFNNQLKTDASENLKKIIDNETRLTEELDDFKKKLDITNLNNVELDSEISEIKVRLLEIEESAKFQEERNKQESILEGCKNSSEKLIEKRKILIGKRGFFAFTNNVFSKCNEVLEYNRKKGDLPYKIKEQFIDDLLSEGKCICGAGIKENTPEYNSISSYRKSAGNFEMESEFIDTSSKVKQQDKEFRSLELELNGLQKEYDSLLNSKENALKAIDELSYKIQDTGLEDVVNLEARRESLELQLSQSISNQGYYDGKIKEIDVKLVDLMNEKERLKAIESTHSIYEKRVAVTEVLQKSIDDLFSALSDQVRIDLSEKVNTTFKDIIRKPYTAEIDSNYALQIYKKTDTNEKQKIYEKSTGENQVTSLSFIGSVISQAKERYNQEQAGGFYRGGLFPLVMDSPFGALDDDYREKIAHYIPRLAEQVIIMVSNSQWEGVVKDRCIPKAGGEWSLIYHSPSITSEQETHYIKSSGKYEYTEIREN